MWSSKPAGSTNRGTSDRYDLLTTSVHLEYFSNLLEKDHQRELNSAKNDVIVPVDNLGRVTPIAEDILYGSPSDPVRLVPAPGLYDNNDYVRESVEFLAVRADVR